MIPEKIFRNNNTFVHVHSTEKIIILTTLRTASSFCLKELNSNTGWLPRQSFEDVGVDKLIEYHNCGYQFNAVVKEPWSRLTSAMEIVVPPVPNPLSNSIYSLSAPEIQQNFTRSINLIVQRFGVHDVTMFGGLNYCCNDVHMTWGTHTSAMFLEAVGVPVKPLLLDNADSIPDYSPRSVESFNGFLRNLEFADYTSVIRPPNLTLGNENNPDNPNKISFRSNRYIAWLQCCTRVLNHDGRICIPTYSVHDWINHDNLLFNNFLNIDAFEVDRQVVARGVIAGIIKDMWKKLNIREIAINQRLKDFTYPWDAMFNLLGTFKDYSDQLPEFYDDRWHRVLFENNTRMSRQYPVPQSTPNVGNTTSSTWSKKLHTPHKEKIL